MNGYNVNRSIKIEEFQPPPAYLVFADRDTSLPHFWALVLQPQGLGNHPLR